MFELSRLLSSLDAGFRFYCFRQINERQDHEKRGATCCWVMGGETNELKSDRRWSFVVSLSSS